MRISWRGRDDKKYANFTMLAGYAEKRNIVFPKSTAQREDF